MKKNIFKIAILSFTLLFLSACTLDFNNNSELSPFEDKICSTTIEKTTHEIIEENIELATTYEEVKKSVVTVISYDSSYVQLGSGSGVVVAEDQDYAYLYTNAHVIENGNQFEVVFYNFKREVATFLQMDTNEDVAILRFDKNTNYEVGELGNSDSLSIGQSIFTVGSPLGINYANTLTSGVISNLNVEVDSNYLPLGQSSKYMIQIDAPLNPGNSGGPLFSKDGRVIGINTLKITSSPNGDDVESFNYSIPINFFDLVATTLLENGSYSRPKIGILVSDLAMMSIEQKNNSSINLENGALISEVSSNGAANGILEEGDIITSINGVEIITLSTLSSQLLKHLPGDEITIEYYDSGSLSYKNSTLILGS